LENFDSRIKGKTNQIIIQARFLEDTLKYKDDNRKIVTKY